MSNSPDLILGCACGCTCTEECPCVGDTLKPEYAVAVRKVDLEGVSVRSYAEASGITQGNTGCGYTGPRGPPETAGPGLRDLCHPRVLRLSVQELGT